LAAEIQKDRIISQSAMLPRHLKMALRAAWAMGLAGVAAGSLMPSDSLPLDPSMSDKALHVGAYLALALLPSLHETARVTAWSVIGVTGMSIGLEFAQRLRPDRSFEWADIAANLGGAALGWLVGVAWRRWRRGPR
jgi:VanZ family protein